MDATAILIKVLAEHRPTNPALTSTGDSDGITGYIVTPRKLRCECGNWRVEGPRTYADHLAEVFATAIADAETANADMLPAD